MEGTAYLVPISEGFGGMTLEGRRLIARADVVLCDPELPLSVLSAVCLWREMAGQSEPEMHREGRQWMRDRVQAGGRVAWVYPCMGVDDGPASAEGLPFVHGGRGQIGPRNPRALPLDGATVVVTRMAHQVGELADDFRHLGAEVITLPLMHLVPPRDGSRVRRALARVEDFDWIVFTSANGVTAFMERVKSLQMDLRRLSGVKLAVIGDITGSQLLAHGLVPDLAPAGRKRSEGLVDALAARANEGAKILLSRAEEGREALSEGLRAHGFAVEEVPLYRTVPRRHAIDEAVGRAMAGGAVDYLALTSPRAVREAASRWGLKALGGTRLAVIGEVTADAAHALGFRPAVMPEEPSMEALKQALKDHWRWLKDA